MVKPGSIVRYRFFKTDHICGVSKDRKMVTITKDDCLMFLEEKRTGLINFVKMLTGSGIIVTIMAEASEFEVLDGIQ